MLGVYYTMLANLGIRPSREVIPLARAAELEALRVDPSLPEAHAILGVCDGIDYEWSAAESRWRWRWLASPFHATFVSGTGTITCCGWSRRGSRGSDDMGP